MHVVSFLRNGGTLSDLEAKYAIKLNRHKKYPNLVLLKYNQIDSPMGERIVQECRGLILDESDNWNIVCRPFDKFFNYGEGHAAEIDWPSASVMEKFDGSLATLYYYDNAWRVATSGTPDASGDVNGFGFSFEELFWKTFRDLNYELPDPSLKNFCFMFELMTHYNRVVVMHPKPRIVLIGSRNRETGNELGVHMWAGQDWAYANQHSLGSIDEIVKSFEAINPVHQEGYVVVDKNFNRIKVKHPGYVAIHQLRSNLSPKNLLELVRRGEQSEVLTYFPEWTNEIEAISKKFDELRMATAEAYAAIYHLESQKEFASFAKKAAVPDALFKMRAGKISSWNQYWTEMRIEQLMSTLGLKTPVEDSNGLVEA